MGGLHDPGFISTCSKEKDGPFGTCPGHINGIYQFQLSMVLGNSLSLHPLIPPFPEIQKNLRPKRSLYDLSSCWTCISPMLTLLQALTCYSHQIRSIRPPSTRPLMDLYRRTYKSSAIKSTTSSPLYGNKHHR